MTSYSIVFRVTFSDKPEGLVLPGASAVPYGVVVDFDRLERRIDVKPCNIAIGEMTPAPAGHILLTWKDGESVAIPENLVRTIVLNP